MKDYKKLVMEIKSFAIATIGEDGRPDSRIIDLMMEQDGLLFFLTARGKNFYRQLAAQQFISMTGMTKNYEAVTIRGKVKPVSREYLKTMFEKNPSMNDMYPGQSSAILEAFCLYEGQGEIFDLSDVPICRETFFIGNPQTVHQKGYLITDRCTGCGVCAGLCPQQCIDEGAPYTIRQSECLHCGWCSENCPSSAINRLEGAVVHET